VDFDDCAFERLHRSSSSLLSRQSVDEYVAVTVETQNMNYFVGAKNARKQILHNVNVRFDPGSLHAMIGPSGAGKTSIINALLGNCAGKVTGHIFVNGLDGPPEDFKSIAKLIPQEDVLMASFTVREILYYQSELVLPQALSRAEKDIRIAQVVNSLSLEKCLDVVVGSVENKGISGGQRKRLSIAVDLLSNPMVLLVDEPTSGLDSKTAEDVVQILRSLAHGEDGAKRTVITTIHQPSYRIFKLFDDLTLLVDGRVAYRGLVENVEAYFANLGLATPPRENPADHYMRLLQDDEWGIKLPQEYAAASGYCMTDTQLTNEGSENETSEDISCVQKCCNALKRLCSCKCTPESNQCVEEFDDYQALSSMMKNQKKLQQIERYPVSRFHQFLVLFRRANWDAVKDPNKFFRTLLLKLAVGLLVGTVWFRDADPPSLRKIVPLEGAMFVLVMNSVVDTLAVTLIIFPTQRSQLLRDYKNGVYSLAPFYAALMLSMGSMSVIYVGCMTIPIYLMVGLQLAWRKFVNFLLIMLFLTCIGNALGVIIGATSADLITAQNKLMPMLAPLLLFSGYVIPYNTMKPFYKVFYKASFFQYGLSALQLNELHGLEFPVLEWEGRRFNMSGDFILDKMFSLDPETHHIADYVLILLGYAIGITFIGYFFIKRALLQKTG